MERIDLHHQLTVTEAHRLKVRFHLHGGEDGPLLERDDQQALSREETEAPDVVRNREVLRVVRPDETRDCAVLFAVRVDLDERRGRRRNGSPNRVF